MSSETADPSYPELIRKCEYLEFDYKGKRVRIPIAPGLTDLKEYIHQRSLPQLDRMRRAAQDDNTEVGLAMTWHMGGTDTLDETTFARELIGAVSTGTGNSSQGTPNHSKKLQSYEPRYTESAQWMRREGGTWMVSDIAVSTFIIGLISYAIPPHPHPTVDEMINATTPEITGCIAVEGTHVLQFLQVDPSHFPLARVSLPHLAYFLDWLETPVSYAIQRVPPMTTSIVPIPSK